MEKQIKIGRGDGKMVNRGKGRSRENVESDKWRNREREKKS
jgi:hypothetical protein